MDVASLTDKELRAALVSTGVAVGPITSSTRKLIEKRLIRIYRNSDTNINDGESEGKSEPDTETTSKPIAVAEGSTEMTPAIEKTPIEEMGTEDVASNPKPESRPYFAVALSIADPCPPQGEDFVFSEVFEALMTAKAHPGARFKQFPTKEEAIYFASGPSLLLTNRINHSKSLAAESCDFSSPSQPELIDFMRCIERGQLSLARKIVWSNPRYLISAVDTPVILQVACRYNALHLCALNDRPTIAMLILETLSDERFMSCLYPRLTAEERNLRIDHMLDLYLNMPNKGNCETSLHFACKFGNVEVVKLLLDYTMTNRLVCNDHGETPEQVTCARVNDCEDKKEEIIKLLQATCFVPLLRPADKSHVASVGEPQYITDLAKPHTQLPVTPGQSVQAPLIVDACAGPMSPAEARDFRKKWIAPDSIELKKQYLSICCRDNDKGLERVGRILATEKGYGWREYWDFLEESVDMATPEGLTLLEEYLKRRMEEEQRSPRIIFHQSSNTTLCEETFVCEDSNRVCDDDSLVKTVQINAVNLAVDEHAMLELQSLALKKLVADTDEAGNVAILVDRTPFIKVSKESGSDTGMVWQNKADHDSNPGSLRQDNLADSLGSQMPELCSVMNGMDVTKKKTMSVLVPKTVGTSESSDFESCGSNQSDNSFESYHTASNSPNRTPPRIEAPVFILGPEPTKVDNDVLYALNQRANITPEFPNVNRWHKNITAYSEEARNKWSTPRRDRPKSLTTRASCHSLSGRSSPGRAASHFHLKDLTSLQAVRTNLLTVLSDFDAHI